MDTWILRYSGPRPRIGVPRDLVVLERTEAGEEVECRPAPLNEAVSAQVGVG